MRLIFNKIREMRPLFKRITISFIVLMGVELFIRVMYPAPRLPLGSSDKIDDRHLPYRHRPNLSMRFIAPSGEYQFEHRYNNWGFRDVEHSLVKPKDTFRILALGDDFTFGQGAAFTRTYLSVLEEKLNSRGADHPKVEIVKAGVSGFFPEPERLLLEHYGLKFHPDLILVGFLPNDVAGTAIGMDAIKVSRDGYVVTKKGAGLGRIVTWLYKHSHAFRRISRRYVTYKRYKNKKGGEVRWPEIFKPNGFHEKDWLKVEEEYGKIIALAKKNNAEILFLHIPQNGPWKKSVFYPSSRLSKWCKEQGVGFVDTLPALGKVSMDNTLYWKKDGHCNAFGYNIIAKVVYSKLVRENLVP